ncbi:unnamed protein product [Polarella glacialis]|uniref:Uncharacterized protein n=1 Tax=Polarella glacialis TaxID=89957 RepID=A0A813I819_POLGL|nr:unnamed protein product [Polarella glacialis]
MLRGNRSMIPRHCCGIGRRRPRFRSRSRRCRRPKFPSGVVKLTAEVVAHRVGIVQHGAAAAVCHQVSPCETLCRVHHKNLQAPFAAWPPRLRGVVHHEREVALRAEGFTQRVAEHRRAVAKGCLHSLWERDRQGEQEHHGTLGRKRVCGRRRENRFGVCRGEQRKRANSSGGSTA